MLFLCCYIKLYHLCVFVMGRRHTHTRLKFIISWSQCSNNIFIGFLLLFDLLLSENLVFVSATEARSSTLIGESIYSESLPERVVERRVPNSLILLLVTWLIQTHSLSQFLFNIRKLDCFLYISYLLLIKEKFKLIFSIHFLHLDDFHFTAVKE